MQGLAEIARRWHDMFPEGGPEDGRLKPLVTSLATRSLTSDYTAATAKFAGAARTRMRACITSHARAPVCAVPPM